MTFRTLGVDLAIRGDHIVQIRDDGRPIRFRHDPASLGASPALERVLPDFATRLSLALLQR